MAPTSDRDVARRRFLAVQAFGVMLLLLVAFATRLGTQVVAPPGYLRSLAFAVAGYACLVVWLGRPAEPASVGLLGRFGYGWFTVATAVLLLACAARAPLLVHADALTGWLIADLVVGGLATVALLVGVLGEPLRRPRGWWEASVVGTVALLLHVVAVDAALAVSRMRG